MKISIIIPVLNEEGVITDTIRTIRKNASGLVGEIICVDGGSSDETAMRAREAGARTEIAGSARRSVQMNVGAEQAEHDLLYFLHADSRPPPGFDALINKALKEGFPCGCFRLKFDWDHPVLRFYAWCTKFDLNAFRFGDQSLFVTRRLFERVGGFDEELMVMEDNVIVKLLKKESPFKIISSPVVTSARKYRETGVIKTQLVFALIYFLFLIGFDQHKLKEIYRLWLIK